MQLTEDQLDVAARKLCELWGFAEPFESPLIEACRIRIEGTLSSNFNTIAAIIHAVTREQKDEVRE